MGWFWGSDESDTTKVSTNATLNSNVTIGHTVDVTSEEILTLLIIITIVKVLGLTIHLYRTLARNMKRKYINRSSPDSK